METLSLGVIILIGAIMIVPYFLPTIIAMMRGHHNKFPIFLVNLFFGWSLLGWVIALIWAFVKPPPTQAD